MGWMSWEIFRCRVDCVTEPEDCISEKLYHAQADAMVEHGFLSAGYDAIHMDDCWERKLPPRDPKTSKLVGDPVRSPLSPRANLTSFRRLYHPCAAAFPFWYEGAGRVLSRQGLEVRTIHGRV